MIVKVSAAMLRQLFRPCSVEFIRDVCKARCCESSTQKQGTLITINPSEQERIEGLGGAVVAGILRTPNRKCVFKTAENLCGIHEAGQPFGCVASPFTINKHGTLIVRNRYRLLKCYKTEGAVPAYIAHSRSLCAILGDEEAKRITGHLNAGLSDTLASIEDGTYAMLVQNDSIKRDQVG